MGEGDFKCLGAMGIGGLWGDGDFQGGGQWAIRGCGRWGL